METTADGGFDPEVWDELLEIFGRDGVAKMIEVLLLDLPQQRQRLDSALIVQDRAAVKCIAHDLRGVAMQFGATDLAERWSHIERVVADGAPLADIATTAARMLDRHAALTRTLKGALRGA